MTSWYWCLTHARVEAADDRDDVDNALGPYESEDAARNWRETNEARAERWKAEDKAWRGDEDDDDADDA